MRTVLPANWQSGLADVVSEGVFATPSIAGWVLVVGRDLAAAMQDPSEMEVLLPPLSEQFGTAMWFSTDEIRDVHGWAVAEQGALQRGYAYDSENGHTYWHGEVLDAERELDCFVDDPRDQSDDKIKWWPDRRIVLALAARWSIDPSKLSELAADSERSTGWVGRM